MRVSMRSLLSRKSQKGSERYQEQESSHYKPGAYLPPLDHIGERVFPIRNLPDNAEIPWLPSSGRNGTSVGFDAPRKTVQRLTITPRKTTRKVPNILSLNRTRVVVDRIGMGTVAL